METKKKSKLWRNIGIFVAFVIVLNIVTRIEWGSDKKEVVQVEEPKKANTTKLFVIAKEAVKQNLKSPATADFPYSSNAVFVGGLTDSIYNVRCFVDSQNGFGAMIRSNWNVKLKYLGGDIDEYKNWQVLDVAIQ